MGIEKKALAVEMDPEGVRASMELWRNALDMKVPVADEFKIHFMQNRKPILQNYVKTGKAWVSLLRNMTASADADALTEFRDEVEAFVTWAEDELKVIDGFAKES